MSNNSRAAKKTELTESAALDAVSPVVKPVVRERIQGWVLDGKVNGDRVIPTQAGVYRVAAFVKAKGWTVDESEFQQVEAGSFVLADYEGRYVLAEKIE